MKNKISYFISKVLLSIIVILGSLIYVNKSDNNLKIYKDNVFNNTLKFTKIKNYYEHYFGEVLPQNSSDAESVFSENLVYKSIKDYHNGEKLTVNTNTLVHSLSSGIVVFIGQKEDFGNTIVIQGIDGYDIWYGALENINVTLYDYIEKDTLIGQTKDDYLYLLIKKDNSYIKYEDYQNK